MDQKTKDGHRELDAQMDEAIALDNLHDKWGFETKCLSPAKADTKACVTQKWVENKGKKRTRTAI